MTWLSTARLVTFVTSLFFSVIVICLSADLISATSPLYFQFSGLALATGLLTVLTVTPMFVVDMFRQGSFFSWVLVEISWLGFLWVLWLSSGSYAAWTNDQLLLDQSSCNFGFLGIGDVDGLETASRSCHEIKAIMAFSFLVWLMVLGYTATLLILAIRAHERGHSAWKTSVRDGVLLYPAAKTMGHAAQAPTALATIPQSYPPQMPQMQHSYPTSIQV
jgi:hypothetical protein